MAATDPQADQQTALLQWRKAQTTDWRRLLSLREMGVYYALILLVLVDLGGYGLYRQA